MGHWSVMASVDLLDDNCNYDVSMDPPAALDAVEAAVARPGRVLVRRADSASGDPTVEVLTIKHTPAWAFLVPFALLLFARVDRLATVSVSASPTGSVLRARGVLDTAAAQRLRALRAADG